MAKQFTLTRINLVCERFEDQWQSGTVPTIREFLDGFEGQSRQNLFFHLLEIDLDYRASTGHHQSLDDWLQEYSEFAEILQEAFANQSGRDPTRSKSFSSDETNNLKQGRETNARNVPHETLPALPGDLRSGKRGATLGGYQLEEVVGKGGMGIVYRARQLSLNRIVALKMIRASQAEDAEFLQRFHVEAQIAASLKHPGIVQVYDVGSEDGHHFFSMELVTGESLAEIVARNPLSNRRAAEIALQISTAIDFAHSHDLIHRDLKPANVLICQTGGAKITDFGLAKTLEADANLTATGHVLGTPAYMPPEQAMGAIQSIGKHSDIYSMGAILYELLTGRPPFQSPSPYDTLFQVMNHEPVAPRKLNPGINRDLETICLKCLEKEPSRRYPSARLLADDLQRFLEDRPILARPVSILERAWRWSRRNRQVAALLAAVTVSVITGLAVSIYFAILAESRVESARKNEAIAKQQTQQTIQTIERTVELLANPNVPIQQRRRLVLNELLSSLNEVYRGFDLGERINSSKGQTQLFLGNLSLDFGDESGQDATARTIEYYQRAVALLGAAYEAMEPEAPDANVAFYYATALHNLADIYFSIHDLEQSEACLNQSIEVNRKQLKEGPEDEFFQMAYTLNCKLASEIASEKQDIAAAERWIDLAIETAEPLGTEGSADRIQALRVLAALPGQGIVGD